MYNFKFSQFLQTINDVIENQGWYNLSTLFANRLNIIKSVNTQRLKFNSDIIEIQICSGS